MAASSSAIDLTGSDDDDHGHGGYDAELEALKEEHRLATQHETSLDAAINLCDDDDGSSRAGAKRQRHSAALPAGAVVVDVDMVKIKLMIPNAPPLEFSVHGDVKLANLFATRVVRRLLRTHFGVTEEAPGLLARKFEVAIPGPANNVLRGGALHATSFAEVLGTETTRGVLHLRERGGGGLKQGHDLFVGGGVCDGVEIVRLGPNKDSPVLHIKNFGKDQGAGLLSKLTIETHHFGPRRRHNGVLPNPGQITIGAALLYECADRCLDLAEAAVQRSGHAYAKESLASLKTRSQYFQSAALFYNPQMTLHRHTDGGIGHWLVLFSFGHTVRFFAGDKSVDFESGDALIFLGATVMHGVDMTLDHATLRGHRCKLPQAVEQATRGTRMSLQARQQ